MSLADFTKASNIEPGSGSGSGSGSESGDETKQNSNPTTPYEPSSRIMHNAWAKSSNDPISSNGKKEDGKKEADNKTVSKDAANESTNALALTIFLELCKLDPTLIDKVKEHFTLEDSDEDLLTKIIDRLGNKEFLDKLHALLNVMPIPPGYAKKQAPDEAYNSDSSDTRAKTSASKSAKPTAPVAMSSTAMSSPAVSSAAMTKKSDDFVKVLPKKTHKVLNVKKEPEPEQEVKHLSPYIEAAQDKFGTSLMQKIDFETIKKKLLKKPDVSHTESLQTIKLKIDHTNDTAGVFPNSKPILKSHFLSNTAFFYSLNNMLYGLNPNLFIKVTQGEKDVYYIDVYKRYEPADKRYPAV